jgi:hypothetical protein
MPIRNRAAGAGSRNGLARGGQDYGSGMRRQSGKSEAAGKKAVKKVAIIESASTIIEPPNWSCTCGMDSNRELISTAAAKLYARGRRGSYDFVASDFFNSRVWRA